MAEGFNAGSVFVEIGAQIAKFKKDMAEARGTLDEFAASAVQASSQLDRGGGSALTAFDQIQNQSRQAAVAFGDFSNKVTQATINLQRNTQNFNTQINTVVNQTSTVVNQLSGGGQVDRLSTSFARAANRIISVQIAMAALAGSAGNGLLGDSLKALSNGVQVASASLQLFHKQLSVTGAGVIALGVAIESFVFRAWEEAIKSTQAMTEQMEKTRKSTTALADSLKDITEKGQVFGDTWANIVGQKLSATEARFSANQKRIREISDELRKLQEQIDAEPFGFGAKEKREQRETLVQERTNLNRQQDDIRRTAGFDRANAEVLKLLENTKKVRQEFENTEIAGQKALELGVADPAEVASKNLSAARGVFDKLLEDNLKIIDASNAYNLSLEDREKILKRLHPLSELQGAAKGVQDAKALNEAIKATNDLAKSFSSAVGDGLRDAILNSKSAMEALADIGNNLFANMVDQFTKRLETGLADVFKSITGAAGEGIGLAVTGIFGAAGAVLGHLGNKSESTFGNVRSAVTSSEQTRGIIAGPSSIAIAQVGEDLGRAVAPVVDRLDILITISRAIARNTKGGGGGAADAGGSQVQVATDLAS